MGAKTGSLGQKSCWSGDTTTDSILNGNIYDYTRNLWEIKQRKELRKSGQSVAKSCWSEDATTGGIGTNKKLLVGRRNNGQVKWAVFYLAKYILPL
jgi:hypothetical protein